VTLELLQEQVRILQGRIQALEQELWDEDDEFLEVLPHLAQNDQGGTAAKTERALWDLMDRGDAGAVLRGHEAAVFMAGVKVSVGGPGAGSDDVGPIYSLVFTSGQLCVYLVLRRTATVNVATVNCAGTSFPDGDDDEEVFPLWQLAWNADEGKVDWSKIIDMRHTARWTAGA